MGEKNALIFFKMGEKNVLVLISVGVEFGHTKENDFFYNILSQT